MSNILKIAGAGVSAAAEETDANFNQTVLLLHGDGSDGAQNNTFLDSSSNGFTITRNPATGPNAPTQGTFSPFSAPDGRWSVFCDGTNQYLTASDDADFEPGTGDFTINFWVYHTTAAGSLNVYIAQTTNGISLYRKTDGKFAIAQDAVAELAATTNAVPVNEWVYLTALRSSGTIKLYIDGVEEASLPSNTTNFAGTGSIGIGASSNGSNDFAGYISNLQIVKGGANVPSGVPTSPLSTSVTNGTVSFLACQSNRFIDNATTPITLTANGGIKVTPFSPFAPTAAYDPAVNGGSMYQIGTTDYVQSDSSADVSAWSTDFTIECWIYPTALSGTNCIWTNSTSNSDGMTAGYTRDGRIILGRLGVNETTSTTGLIKNNTWHHVAWVRSGSSVNIYLNGVSVATPTTTNLETSTTKPMTVGGEFQTTGDTSFPGYISGFRVLKGTAIDFSSVGVPTAPYQASDEANTKLLLNFTNAGIYDSTGKNVLETVGNAQIDTTTKKYGTGSMEFDGTGDYLIFPSSENFVLGTGDFSIQFWLRVNNLPSGTLDAIFDTRPASTQGLYPNLYIDTDGKIKYWVNSADRITATNALSTNTWYFVSLIRDGGDTKLFIDGSQSGSTYSDSNNYIASRLIIGGSFGGGASIAYSLDGFLDEFRWTKGVARDGTVVPTKAFPDL